MKLNRPFFIKTALTAILLTFVTLPANAKNYEDKHQVEWGGVLAAAEIQKEDHNANNSDQRFIAKQTTKIEFVVAMLMITVGLVTSEIFQRNQEQQQLTKDKGDEI